MGKRKCIEIVVGFSSDGTYPIAITNTGDKEIILDMDQLVEAGKQCGYNKIKLKQLIHFLAVFIKIKCI